MLLFLVLTFFFFSSCRSFKPLLQNTNTIMDDYEYVLHGKIFKIETSQKTANIQNLYVSFGGLLMLL